MNPARVAARKREMDDAWEILKDRAEITTDDVVDVTGFGRARCREILRRWEGRVMIKCITRGSALRVYVPCDGVDLLAAPKQAMAGEHVRDPVANMWRAMRVLDTFTPRDVAAIADIEEAPVSEKDAAGYCQLLLRGEYLRVIEKAQAGVRPATYKLTRNTGPLPPREKRIRALWDDNLGGTTYAAGVGVIG
jgi:hypothetical protein